ncbi:hypothetical protein HDU76_006124 [Blyttiomyces sp. JEL0837]|nr:hypothetical protein HDU76_006124 [Blyttiomyces sp. JEL0837]
MLANRYEPAILVECCPGLAALNTEDFEDAAANGMLALAIAKRDAGMLVGGLKDELERRIAYELICPIPCGRLPRIFERYFESGIPKVVERGDVEILTLLSRLQLSLNCWALACKKAVETGQVQVMEFLKGRSKKLMQGCLWRTLGIQLKMLMQGNQGLLSIEELLALINPLQNDVKWHSISGKTRSKLLFYAVSTNNVNTVDFVLQHMSPDYLKNTDNTLSLCLAHQLRNRAILSRLQNAYVHLRSLHNAMLDAVNNHLSYLLVETISLGADVSRMSLKWVIVKGDDIALEMMIAHGVCLSAPGYDALTFAYSKKCIKAFYVLLNAGASLVNGEGILLEAVSVTVVNRLLDAGMKPTGAIVHHAVNKINVDIIMLLIRYGGDFTKWLSSLLIDAVTKSRVSVVETLIKLGANVNYPRGKPLKVACSNKNQSMINILLHAGANPNINDGAVYNLFHDMKVPSGY